MTPVSLEQTDTLTQKEWSVITKTVVVEMILYLKVKGTPQLPFPACVKEYL